LEFLLAVFLVGVFFKSGFRILENFLCVYHGCTSTAKYPESLGIYFPEEEGGGGVPLHSLSATFAPFDFLGQKAFIFFNACPTRRHRRPSSPHARPFGPRAP
jgi:hypothetical protein